MRLIPPVAAPVRVSQVCASLLASRSAGDFASALARNAGMPQAALYGSGRAALASFLGTCGGNGRDEIVVPAYTCWSVPAAVVRAGFRVRPIDVRPDTLDVDREQLASAIGPRTAAVVLAHLFGRSVDVAGAVSVCRERRPDLPVVEDSAQAWPAGPSVADAIVLSFGRGKPLALGSGGALLSSGPAGPAPAVRGGGWVEAASLAATVVLSRPGWYRFPESVPALGIGQTVYDPAFPVDRPFHDWQGSLGLRMLEALPALAERRTRHASALAAIVDRASGWSVPVPGRGPGPVRLPLLAPSHAERDRVRRELRRRGVAASEMYPSSIVRIPELRAHLASGGRWPGADELADRLLTLPVYPFLRSDDVTAIATAFEASTSPERS
jgi:dTDP-4-amino-4,6-dideoxygalactose transaminase